MSASLFFFFKQKTAYEMRISDWSSDVCSSDLVGCCRRDDQKIDLVRFDTGVCKGLLRSAQGKIGRQFALGGDVTLADSGALTDPQIGRASWRERVCQYV